MSNTTGVAVGGGIATAGVITGVRGFTHAKQDVVELNAQLGRKNAHIDKLAGEFADLNSRKLFWDAEVRRGYIMEHAHERNMLSIESKVIKPRGLSHALLGASLVAVGGALAAYALFND